AAAGAVEERLQLVGAVRAHVEAADVEEIGAGLAIQPAADARVAAHAGAAPRARVAAGAVAAGRSAAAARGRLRALLRAATRGCAYFCAVVQASRAPERRFPASEPELCTRAIALD